jgi:periplasmic divalent cation tolerance protein
MFGFFSKKNQGEPLPVVPSAPPAAALPDMNRAVMVYTVCKTPEEARKIVSYLLQNRLIACANIMPPNQSFFYWEDKMAISQEVVVFMKTRAALFPRVNEAIARLHSYDCPCIVALPIEAGHPVFMKWVLDETSYPKD